MERNSDFQLRRAQISDAPQLFDLLEELARFEKLTPPDEAAKNRLLEDGWGPRKRFDAFLAFVRETEKPVAFCVILESYSTFMARPRLLIEDLYVRPEFRRRGIGKALVTLCLEEAHRRGCERVECFGLDWNANAHDVYEHLGATQLTEWFLYRFDKRAIEHHLKPLGVGPKRRSYRPKIRPDFDEETRFR